jgi:hypothetical protein
VTLILIDTLEESLSISTGLATWPLQLTPRICINKSIWLATGGHLPWVHHGYLPGANQIDLFMHFLGYESQWPRLKWTSFLLVTLAQTFLRPSSMGCFFGRVWSLLKNITTIFFQSRITTINYKMLFRNLVGSLINHERRKLRFRCIRL